MDEKQILKELKDRKVRIFRHPPNCVLPIPTFLTIETYDKPPRMSATDTTDTSDLQEDKKPSKPLPQAENIFP